MGLNSRSAVDIKEAKPGLYAALIDGKVAVKLGPLDWSPADRWQLTVEGEKFAVWTKSD
jgi:alpha-amylase